MKFGKKFFIVLGLVALLASLFVTTAFAGGIKTKGFAEVDQYAVLSNQPITLQFKGHLACDKAEISGAVSGKEIYITVKDVKFIGNGKPCQDDRPYGFTKQISFNSLVPGTYTVYVNADGNGKWQKKFKVVAPLLPTPTSISGAASTAKPGNAISPTPAKP